MSRPMSEEPKRGAFYILIEESKDSFTPYHWVYGWVVPIYGNGCSWSQVCGLSWRYIDEIANPLQAFMDDHAEWADATFKGQPVSGVLAHLKKEVQELIDNPDDPHEAADVLGLFTRFWYLKGGTAQSLIKVGREKLEICKTRTYGEPDEDGAVQHIPECQHDGDTEVVWSSFQNKDGSWDGDEICLLCKERWIIKVDEDNARID